MVRLDRRQEGSLVRMVVPRLGLQGSHSLRALWEWGLQAGGTQGWVTAHRCSSSSSILQDQVGILQDRRSAWHSSRQALQTHSVSARP